MQKILESRSRIARYKDWFYMPFVVIIGGLMSFGKSSQDRIYMIFFILTTLLLGIKLVLTDYKWKEIVIVGVIGALLLWNFLRNGERTLIITFMAIVGAKDVDLKRVFKVGLWVKIAMSLLLEVLVLTGVVENIVCELPKNWVIMSIPSYGYLNPNTFYLNFFTIVMLAVLAYGEYFKWYVYVIFSAMAYGAYKLVVCRTGIVVWCVFCILLVGMWLASKLKLDKIYMGVCAFLPVIMAGTTIAVTVLSKTNERADYILDKLLTGRIRMFLAQLEESEGFLFGHQPRVPFDNLYYYLIYNDGWLLTIIFLFAYCATMWYSMKKGKYLEVLVLGTVTVYGFMEYSVLNMAWNLSILLMANVLYRGMQTIDEHLQQEIPDH